MSFVLPELPLHEASAVFSVLLGAVLLAPLLARATRLPDIVLLIVAGVVVGPTGLGLLARDGAVSLLGAAGLLYLMFLAGLELDLDDFVATRRESLAFGALTFVVPLVLGTAVARGLGLAPLAAVLIGSCWSSHTLLAYPQFRRAGTAGHRAVATTVGATIITDTAALLVLVVVVRLDAGALTLAFWATLLPSAALLLTATLAGLPRLARRFFAGPGQDPTLRLLFVLVSLFVVAGLTEMIGIEPIIGAFVAGLALNRTVPNGGALMERVELLGNAVFVPLFLVATGMLVDLTLLSDPSVLVMGAAFAATAMVAKLTAAAIAARRTGGGRDETAAMFALSNAQAAATLAAVVVGVEVGLIGPDVVNAVVLVILVTCVVAALVAARVAMRLATSDRLRPLGTVVVAPVANPASAAGLLRLASSFARTDAGIVVPLVVAPTGSDDAEVAARRALLDDVTRATQSAGVEARPLLRIDASPAAGIEHTVAESDPSLLVLGWEGRPGGPGRLGGVVDRVVDRVATPTLVVRDGASEPRRVLVVLDGSLVRTRGRGPLVLALRAAARVAQDLRLEVDVTTNVDDAAVSALVAAELGRDPVLRTARRAALVADVARADDLVVLPTLADHRSRRTLVTAVLPDIPDGATVVVAIAKPSRSPTALGAVSDDRAGASPGTTTSA